jgi:hypothetical protein
VSDTFREEMRKPLDPGSIRSYVEDFDDLRMALRETHASDPYTVLSVRVSDISGAVVTHAMGSIDLCLAAITEGLTLLAPTCDPQYPPRVEVQRFGSRKGWLVP